ncbi:MAG: hypothetical protein HYR85_12365 [Planctomycetes bacterium]|nr:hypothetical protein [Planctomycetota bacterium]MBI3846372.1 hypothetical protein [Planctomycetota bacterium]
MRHRRSLAASVFLLASLTACHHEESHSASWVYVSNASFGSGKSSLEFETAAAHGDIVIDPKLPSEYKAVTLNGVADPSNGVRVRGHLVEFGEGTLRIGDRAYGRLSGAVHIEIRPNGIFVNGESRGELEP